MAKKKRCIGCRKLLVPTAFYAHSMMSDGRLGRCKECHKAAMRERYHEKMQDAEWRKRERARGRVKWRENGHTWRPIDPVHKAANTAVHNAVRDGRLTPRANCEDCGHDYTEYRREGHHEDYRKPLDVVWLCSLCHGKRHRTSV